MTKYTRKPSLRTIEERNKLVENNLDLCRIICCMLMRRHYSVRRMGYDESMSYGNLGLLRAAELWDETKGANFRTFAAFWVTRLIKNAVAREWPFLRAIYGKKAERRNLRLDWMPQPSDEFKKQEIREEVERMLRRLPKSHAQVLDMQYLQGYKQKEIAVKLGVSHQLVSSKSLNALTRLMELESCQGR